MIPLKCGDPSNKPASSTKFVLPFAYKLSDACGQASSSPYYELIKEVEGQFGREKYLTHETADVLFRRTKRFRLKSEKPNIIAELCFEDCKEHGHIQICMKPPELILFERDTKDVEVLQTGFLVVELYFPLQDGKCPNLDNLLEINELFRCWQRPFKKHCLEKGYGRLMRGFFDELGLNPPEGCHGCYFERWELFLTLPLRDEFGCYQDLFPSSWKEDAKSSVFGEKSESPGWAIYSDSKAFVWTCAITEKGGNDLRGVFNKPTAKPWDFGYWIKLLNVDSPKKSLFETNESTEFERDWAQERTYKRWEKSGTFYGFNYHSGAMMASGMEEPDLWRHFGEMYFDQIVLLLYIRVTLFRFSMSLNQISSDVLDEKKVAEIEKWKKDFTKLRWQFSLFTNFYQFPLLSNQQQGIEMYTIARSHLDVDDLFKEVQSEIYQCHEYLSAEKTERQSDRVELLTYTATVGIVFALATSFWGMNMLVDDIRKIEINKSIATDTLWFLLSLLGFILIIIVVLYFKPGYKLFQKMIHKDRGKEEE